MVTYKHEQFIKGAVLSVIEQQGDFEVELIVADDLSPDRTPDIIRELIASHPKGHRIKYTRHDNNKGMFGNFFWALNQCNGKYIAICDGDDYWTDHQKLKKQIEFLENNPGFVVSCHNARKVNEFNEIIAEQVLPEKEQRDYNAKELQKGAWLLSLTLCFRNVIKSFPPEFMNVPSPDSFFTALLGEHGDCKFQHDVLPACYRVHSGGVFSLKGEKQNLINRTETHRLLLTYFGRIRNAKLKKHYLELYYRNASRLCELYLSSSESTDYKLLKKQVLKTVRKYGSLRTYLSVLRSLNQPAERSK